MTEIEQLKAELERVRRQNTAMRSALETCRTSAAHLGYTGLPLDAIRQGLKEDAGSDLLTREQVQPLVETLQGVLNSALHPDTAFRAVMVPLDPIRKALAHARTLRLVP
jgi:hypothetical protein